MATGLTPTRPVATGFEEDIPLVGKGDLAMTLSAFLLAIAVYSLVITRMFRGERLQRVAPDHDRFPIAFGHRGELVLGAVAAARIAADPAARPTGYLLLAVAALLPALGQAGAARVVLGLLGAIGAVVALGEIGDPDCGGGPATVLVTVVLLVLAGTAFLMRRHRGGILGGNTGLAGFALAVFALAELAPLALAPAGFELLVPSTGLGARVALVLLLAVVAVVVGLRPNASTGILGVVIALLSLGLLGVPGPCGTSAGWLLTSAMVVVVVSAVASLIRR